MVGSVEIGDYRGNTVIADTLSTLRKTALKKTKVSINIRFKGLVVTDEKSKVMYISPCTQFLCYSINSDTLWCVFSIEISCMLSFMKGRGHT